MKNELVLEQFNILPLNLQKQVLDYIDFLTKKHINKTQRNDDEISDEIKELLKNRIEDHKKKSKNAVSWEKLEEKYEKQYGYEI